MSNSTNVYTLAEAAALVVASYAMKAYTFLEVEVEVEAGCPTTADTIEGAIRECEAAREGQTPRLFLGLMTVELKWHWPGTQRSSYLVSGVRKAQTVVPAGKLPWTREQGETDGG